MPSQRQPQADRHYRSAARRFVPEPEPGTGRSHVLHWIPSYVDGTGTWALQDMAAYEAGEPVTDPDWMLEDESRDIDAADFADWLASMTGYPVAVELDSVRITCPRALRFFRKEPVWWICPADIPV